MTGTMADHVVAITRDLFTAMVDGEPGALGEVSGTAPVLTDPVRAWVDIRGDRALRILVATGRVTAERITRALLGLEEHDDVAADDVGDALGEIANVIGGNVKGLLPDRSVLSLPVVAFGGPGPDGAPLWTRSLQWREEPLVVSMGDVPVNQEEYL